MKKRFLSMLFIACIALSMLPMTVLAAEADGNEDAAPVVELQSEDEVVLPAAGVSVETKTVKAECDARSLISKNGATTIDFVAGLDVRDEKNITAIVKMDLPLDKAIGAVTLGELLSEGTGLDLNDALAKADLQKIADFKTDFEDVNAELDKMFDPATDKIVSALDGAKNYYKTVDIRITDDLTVKNIGVYMVGAVDIESGDLAVGMLAVQPDGKRVTLNWAVSDDNMVITRDKLAAMDMRAKANESIDPKFIHYAYIGVAMSDLVVDGDMSMTELVEQNVDMVMTTKLTKDSAPGLYLQVAMVMDWDNEMYYSEPIFRPFILAPNNADVQFIDENSYINALRAYTYDGEAKSMDVTIDGVSADDIDDGTLVVRYLGIDGHGSLKGFNLNEFESLSKFYSMYNDDEAKKLPTEAGVYLAVALYADKVNGVLDTAGFDFGVMVIEPAAPEGFGLEDAVYPYDANEQRFAALNNPQGLDYFSIAIDRENNIGYVNLPDDFWNHVDRLPTVEGLNLARYIKDFYKSMDDGDGVYDVEFQTIQDQTNEFLDMIVDPDGDGIIETDYTNEILMPALDDAVKEIGVKLNSVISKKADAAYDMALAKLENSGKVPEDLIPVLAKAISVEGGRLDVIEQDAAAAKIYNLVKSIAGEDMAAQAKPEIDKLVATIYSVEMKGVTLDTLEEDVNGLLNALTTELSVDTAEKLVKVALGVATQVISIDEVMEILATVIEKIENQGYLAYLDKMIATLDGIYDIEIDGLRNAVLGLKAPLAAIKNKLLNNDDINRNDIKAFEDHFIQEIVPEIRDLVDQLPDEGMFIFDANPTEEGTYDCVAINISANYYPVIAHATLVICKDHDYEGEWSFDEEDHWHECENECGTSKEKEPHEWPSVSNDGFTWNKAHTEATATIKCSDCEHPLNLVATEEQIKFVVDVEATCQTPGRGHYEATVTIGDKTYTIDSESIAIDIDSDNHEDGCGCTEDIPSKPSNPGTAKPCCDMDFSDVSYGDWFYNDVHYVYCNSLMNGIGGGKFGPGLTTTRGMIVTILYRLEGEPIVRTDCPFEDVAANKYYEDPITWAAANGIVTGYDADTFGPDDYITREQMAAILYRYADCKGYDTDARAKLTKYTDTDKISVYAVNAMSWAVAEGLINGMTETTLAPQGNAVRAQVAAILHRFCVNVAKED